jgi:hypothetical protein
MSTITRSDSQLEAQRMRTASIEQSVQLRHPVPDLQSLQGAYVKNVENLEDRAERMSMGSDIGEEIRKLQLEQKISDSRRASLYSNAAVEPEVKSRNPSISSYANSIVEVNGAARYGGYSPAAFVGSPIGSIRSGSWSQVSHGAVSRSMSRGSRLGQLSNPQFDDGLAHSPPDEPTVHASAFRNSLEEEEDEDSRTRRMKRVSTGRLPSEGSFTRLYNQIAQENGSAAHLAAARIPSDTSFTNIYDQIAGEIRSHLDMPADGMQNPADSSLQPNPVDELSRRLGGVTSAPRSQDPIPPQPPRHSYILPQVERSTELDGFTVIPKGGEMGFSNEGAGPASNSYVYADNLSPPGRPSSAASGDTFQQSQALFRDFDGAHYAGSIRGSTRVPSGDVSELLDHDGASILKALDPPPNLGVPPPRDGMIFYPAPVPKMLNLPQRLSQLPSAAVQARRRTQLLESLPMGNKKSAALMEHQRTDSEGSTARMSKLNLAQLPAQLRASVFFEQQTKREEVEIRDQSAMNTLDDLLDASARAPVSAFTSHPITGAASTGIYKKENASRSSASLQHSLDMKNRKSLAGVKEEPEKDEKRRSSFFGMRRSSVSSANALDDGGKAPNKLRKRNSVAMSAALDDSALTRGPDGEIGGYDRSGATTPLRPRILNENGEEVELGNDEVMDGEEEYEEEEIAEEQFGPPTTLLAELQLRKAQQKQRGRTFQSFPEGMHSTLLELDAVAQLEKQKRQKSRVALAWEDPSLKMAEEAEEDDEDVPLGVLYGNKSKIVKAKLAERGLADWDRPLGLLERRQMEDNEPLSRRRNRLLGIDPNAAAIAAIAARQSQVQIVEPESEESEHEGETLGQRLKRLKEKKVLTDAIGNVDDNRVSHAFSVDMLSALGVDSGVEDDKRKSSISQLGVDSANAEEKRKSNISMLPAEASSADVKRKSYMPLSAAEMSKLNDKRKSSGSSPLLGGERAKTPGTPGDEEEETLGQRRARLQREALERSKQGSQMTLGPDARINTIRPVSTMVPLADPRMSAMFPPDPNAVPVVRPTLNPSRSMADLLKAYPSGKNDARKVSNEMLIATLPQGSLLAQSEQEKQTRTSHIQMNNSQGMGFQRTPSGNTMLNGFQGQVPYQNGMMGMSVYPQMNMAMGGVYGNMSNPNLVMGMPGYQQMGMGVNGYAAASQPNLLQQPMMSSPNMLGGYANGGMPVQHMPYQQQASYTMAVHEPIQEPVLDAGTRSRVDAWRQGVMH